MSAAAPAEGLTEFRVKWAACPTSYNPTQVLFVRALSAQDARELAIDHIERSLAIGWLSIIEISVAKTMPAGEVCR